MSYIALMISSHTWQSRGISEENIIGKDMISAKVVGLPRFSPSRRGSTGDGENQEKGLCRLFKYTVFKYI